MDIQTINMEAVVLGAGDFPSHPIPLTILREAKFVCCADSAAVEYIERIGKPDAIVGDGDSLPEELKQKYADIWHHVGEQDTNDQTKATKYCLSLGFKNIAYVGATGKREDHTLGNISLMAQYIKDYGIHPTMFTDHGMIMSVDKHLELYVEKGQQVSVFNISCKQLESQGLRWECRPFNNWWEGTLNEALSNKIVIDCDGMAIVFVEY